MNAWQSSVSIRSKSAARRPSSRWAATSSSRQDRGMAGHGPHQLRMPQNDPDQQRLLFAGRGQRRRHRLGAVMHHQIHPVRTRQVSVRPPHRARALFSSGRAKATSMSLADDQRLVVEKAFKPHRGGGKHAVLGLACRRSGSTSRLTTSLRAIAMATPSSPICASSPSSQAGSARALRTTAGCGCAWPAHSFSARPPWAGSTDSTSRSRNRRRSPADPVNSPSIAGSEPQQPQMLEQCRRCCARARR
jgi:hypothetical protein